MFSGLAAILYLVTSEQTRDGSSNAFVGIALALFVFIFFFPQLKKKVVLQGAGWALPRPFFVFTFFSHNKKSHGGHVVACQ
jgi:hypothetical protein